jgi:hypothetical protein
LASLPVAERRKTRLAIQKVLGGSDKPSNFPQEALTDNKDVTMHLPMPIGDYTDFCISYVPEALAEVPHGLPLTLVFLLVGLNI